MGCTPSSVSYDSMYIGDHADRRYTKTSARGTNGKVGIRAEETEDDQTNGTLDREGGQGNKTKSPSGIDNEQGSAKRQDKKTTDNIDPRSPLDVEEKTEETLNEGPTEKEIHISELTKQLKRRVNRLCDSDRHTYIEYNRIRTTADVLTTYSNSFGLKYYLNTNKHEEILKTAHKTKQEKTQLLHRMSAIAGAALMFNNPAIADLSDENRATKLAERSSELYDNEWTDMFEGCREKLPPNTEDRQIVESLRNILQFCYELCEQKAAAQRASIYKSLGLNGPQDDTNTNVRIKELQKKSASYNLPKIIESAKQEMIQKHKQKKHKSLSLVLGILTVATTPLRDYVERCVDICWYMQMQEPAMAMQFEPGKDTSKYRQYTQSGPIVDYVVWPVLLLHKGGPMLYRGVAQFKHEDNCTCQSHTKERERKSQHNDVLNTTESVTSVTNVEIAMATGEEKGDKSGSDVKESTNDNTSRHSEPLNDSKKKKQSQTGQESGQKGKESGKNGKEPGPTTGKVAEEFKDLGNRRPTDKKEESALSEW